VTAVYSEDSLAPGHRVLEHNCSKIGGVFRELFLDQTQHTWRKLDREYTPYCDALLLRDMGRSDRGISTEKGSAGAKERGSVRDEPPVDWRQGADPTTSCISIEQS